MRRAAGPRFKYSPAELWADGIVHGLGLSLAIAAAIAAPLALSGRVPAGEMAAMGVYLGTLVLSLGISAAYNLWPAGSVKAVLRRLDHSAIFLLIAGTYTPFMAVSKTWWLLAFVWSVAAAGVFGKLFVPHRFDRVALVAYLGLGWSGIVAYGPLTEALSSSVVWLVIGGGIVYSVGVIFHVWQRLLFQNAIWHAFVVTAACIHFVAVWKSAIA
ncbi:hemolysin III [Rhodopseudomonas julia]|uniref:Hemolysin III n=1 Tax=Rhodopseudomonas julia TaxID=200617 RepID=A0ABU0C5Y5_9BRAD|nr:hemolysin III family protein [Rhodopseudomonas julia]MDQ0325935.1 hemolysin III [Rhodopseudomonas julia]